MGRILIKGGDPRDKPEDDGKEEEIPGTSPRMTFLLCPRMTGKRRDPRDKPEDDIFWCPRMTFLF